jgi:bacterioferritin
VTPSFPERGDAIENCREMINCIGQRDPTTQRMLESILALRGEHAEDFVDLRKDLPKD